MKNNKKIYVKSIDAKSLEQFENCLNNDFVLDGALMPDAHAGYVAPIGSVFLCKDFVVPAWVGYDIGCGVTAIYIKSKTSNEKLNNLIKENKESLYLEVQKRVPMGLGKLNSTNNIHRSTKESFRKILDKLKQSPHDEEIFDWVRRKSESNLGTLGEGNHFIEIGEDIEGEIWVVIHSGSRNIGHKVAEKYMIKSAGKTEKFEETHPLNVESKLGKEYLAILEFGLEFALLNRIEIALSVVECIEFVLNDKLDYEIWTNKNHNHAVKELTKEFGEVYIHRKGATPAKKDERGVIPGTMRDGSYLVLGLGNKEFLESSSHGAGRKMSRAQAKKEITLQQFEESMKGIYGTIKEGTLDEAPDAYKDIFKVMESQKESVTIVNHIKPIINWKGDNKQKRFK